MPTVLGAVTLLVLALSGPSCSDRSSAPKEEATAPVPGAAQPDAGAAAAPSELDRIAALLPVPAGMQVVKPLHGEPERVSAVYCFGKTAPAEANTQIEAALTSAGWTEVTTTAHPAVKNAFIVRATRPSYGLHGVARPGQTPGCLAAEGKRDLVIDVLWAGQPAKAARLPVDEIKGLLPTPASATLTREVKAEPQRFSMILCVDSKDAGASATALASALAPTWPDAAATAASPNGGAGIRARKPPYRLSASLRPGRLPGCQAADGKTDVIVTVLVEAAR